MLPRSKKQSEFKTRDEQRPNETKEQIKTMVSFTGSASVRRHSQGQQG